MNKQVYLCFEFYLWNMYIESGKGCANLIIGCESSRENRDRYCYIKRREKKREGGGKRKIEKRYPM